MIKVLIADDSALMRKTIKQILESDPEIQVIGLARDGVDVVEKARELRPDVITMDVNMPRQDGLTALQYIVTEEISPVVMVSSLTQEGAVTTFEALELGAFDFVAKPGGTVSTNLTAVAEELIAKVKMAAEQKRVSVTRRLAQRTKAKAAPALPVKKFRAKGRMKAVAIGISTGGPKEIYEVLPRIPKEINAAFFLVQHMPPNFTSTYVKRLGEECSLEVVEAEPGMKVSPGVVYVAKGGRHLTVLRNSEGDVITRLPSRPEHLFIPSVSVMMKSVLEVFGQDTIGVLMTGMGNDGADAMVAIHEKGGITIAESEKSAIVFGMPAEAIRMGGARYVVPSWEIADYIIRAVLG